MAWQDDGAAARSNCENQRCPHADRELETGGASTLQLQQPWENPDALTRCGRGFCRMNELILC